MKIDHLGIATKGIEEALGFWSDALGLENIHTETVEDVRTQLTNYLATYGRASELLDLVDCSL